MGIEQSSRERTQVGTRWQKNLRFHQWNNQRLDLMYDPFQTVA